MPIPSRPVDPDTGVGPKLVSVVTILSESVKQMLGKDPKLIYQTSAWDMGAVNRLRILCVKFGAGGPFVLKH